MFDPAIVLLWLKNNPEWLAFGIFFGAFIESFAVIGLLVPGVALLVLISGMAGSVNLPVFYLLLLAYLGACLADILSFLIGTYFEEKLENIWPFVKKPHWLFEARKFFKIYGILGIFIGRFIGPIRALLPLIAGSMGMNIKKFILIDLVSGILWSAIYLLPGYYAGKAVTEGTGMYALILSLVATIAAVYLGSRYRLIRKT